jgi:hypothetical protein
MCDKYIEDILPAIPELVVVKCHGNIVGGPRKKLLEAVFNEMMPGGFPIDRYSFIKQFSLDRI